MEAVISPWSHRTLAKSNLAAPSMLIPFELHGSASFERHIADLSDACDMLWSLETSSERLITFTSSNCASESLKFVPDFR